MPTGVCVANLNLIFPNYITRSSHFTFNFSPQHVFLLYSFLLILRSKGIAYWCNTTLEPAVKTHQKS